MLFSVLVVVFLSIMQLHKVVSYVDDLGQRRCGMCGISIQGLGLGG